jgi:HTH-type transcriptional regulator/antitoxin HigA
MTANRLKDTISALYELPAAARALLSPIADDVHYRQALEAEENLSRLIAGQADHPLGGVYATLIEHIAAYEDTAYPTEPTPPHTMLAFLLEQTGLRQGEVAERLGVHQSNVSRLVSGQVAFTTDLIKKLSEIFGVPATVFLN